jgi:hypothetical protein
MEYTLPGNYGETLAMAVAAQVVFEPYTTQIGVQSPAVTPLYVA